MAISKPRAKQIRKNFRKNYGPKPTVTTADIKSRRGAVKAGQKTYMKKDGSMAQLTRKQTLRTKQKLNKAAKRNKPKLPIGGGGVVFSGKTSKMKPKDIKKIRKESAKLRQKK